MDKNWSPKLKLERDYGRQHVEIGNYIYRLETTRGNQGPVVQSIISLTSSLRGQLVKCFMALLPNTMIVVVEKIGKAFAV